MGTSDLQPGGQKRRGQPRHVHVGMAALDLWDPMLCLWVDGIRAALNRRTPSWWLALSRLCLFYPEAKLLFLTVTEEEATFQGNKETSSFTSLWTQSTKRKCHFLLRLPLKNKRFSATFPHVGTVCPCQDWLGYGEGVASAGRGHRNQVGPGWDLCPGLMPKWF